MCVYSGSMSISVICNRVLFFNVLFPFPQNDKKGTFSIYKNRGSLDVTMRYDQSKKYFSESVQVPRSLICSYMLPTNKLNNIPSEHA